LALDRSVQALKKADRHWRAAWPLFDGLVFDRESLRPELLEVKGTFLVSPAVRCRHLGMSALCHEATFLRHRRDTEVA